MAWRFPRAGKRGSTARGQHPFYPNHVLKNLVVLLAAAAAICAFAAIVPIPMDQMADPLLPPSRQPAVSYWLVRPALALDRLLPPALTGGLLAGFFLFTLLLPLAMGNERSRFRHLAVGALFLMWMAFLLAALWWLPSGAVAP